MKANHFLLFAEAIEQMGSDKCRALCNELLLKIEEHHGDDAKVDPERLSAAMKQLAVEIIED